MHGTNFKSKQWQIQGICLDAWSKVESLQDDVAKTFAKIVLHKCNEC